MHNRTDWKFRIGAVVLLFILAFPAHALKDRDADGPDPVDTPAPKAASPAGTATCPDGRFSDANCQCAAGRIKKYMGNNQYDCARAFNPTLVTVCPSGRFNSDQHPDCACRGGATKAYMGNNQYLCSKSAGKACPLASDFTFSGNQGCKCPADMRLEIKPGNQTGECVCKASDLRKVTDGKTFCTKRVTCPSGGTTGFPKRGDLKYCQCPENSYLRYKGYSSFLKTTLYTCKLKRRQR